LVAAYFFKLVGYRSDYRAALESEGEYVQIKNQRYDDLRKAMYSKSKEECLSLKKAEKKICLWQLASLSQDPAPCELLDLAEDIEKCKNDLKAYGIINGTEIGKCASLDRKELQNACYLAFINTWQKNGQSDNCKLSSLPLEFQQICADHFSLIKAVTDKSQAACGQIATADIKAHCQKTIADLPTDTDGDGLTDKIEKSYGLDFTKKDTDGDGLTDGEELNGYKPDPLSKDSDSDALSDKNEVFLGTDPLKIDTDGDGFMDGAEVGKSFNPCGEGSLLSEVQQKQVCQLFRKIAPKL
jgi:hypothetical protein